MSTEPCGDEPGMPTDDLIPDADDPTGAAPGRHESEAALAAEALPAVADPLYRARGWMKFVGLAEIVSGVGLALTVMGLLVAWLPIWMGVILFKAAGDTRRAVEDSDPAALGKALDRLRTFFVLGGLQAILGVAVVVAAILAGAATITSFLGALAP